MLTTVAAALAALTLVQQSDTTVAVPRGTRLEVDNFAGAVSVRAWDRDVVRVRARHDPGDRVHVHLEEGVLEVSAESERGVPADVQLEISAPRAMPIEVSGVRTDVTVESAAGEVVVETVDGSVQVTGGSGIVSLSSVQGSIQLEGARGRIELSSVNDAVRARGLSGEVTAETVNGAVTLERAEVESADVSTVNGAVEYAGELRDGGVYSFTTHNGSVTVAVPDTASARVSVSTFLGTFESDFDVGLSGGRGVRDVSFVLGAGGARLEIESFQGRMRLVRAGPGLTLPAGGSETRAPAPARPPRPPRPSRPAPAPETP